LKQVRGGVIALRASARVFVHVRGYLAALLDRALRHGGRVYDDATAAGLLLSVRAIF